VAKEPRRARLTKTYIDAQTQPGYYYDTEVGRFAVRVRPSGGRHYVLRLNVDGRQRWYRIGKHGDPWTVEMARAEARRVLGLGANVAALRSTGSATSTTLHPVEAREHARVGVTLAEFAARYLEEHSIPHLAPGSVEAERGLLGLREPKAAKRERKPRKKTKTIIDALGKERIDRITRADVTRLHLAWKRTPSRANRAVALLSHMFNCAEKWGLRADSSNPCRHVERFKEGKRERYLSAAELAQLGEAIATQEKAAAVSPFALAAIRLLIFTGARCSEILGLTWAVIDASGPAIRLNRKGRTMSLYLAPPAQAVLAALPRIRDNVYVIAGAREGQPLSLAGLEQVWQVVRATAKLTDVRLHDLRHSFASVAVAGGDSLPIIGALLGHTQPATTQRYAHLSHDPLQAAANRTAAVIEAAMRTTGKPKRGTVSPMRRERK
jgi:integrase